MLRLQIRGFLSFCAPFLYLLLVAVAETTHPSEVNALASVKDSLVDPLRRLENWKNGDPCLSNWTGVVCYDTVGSDGFLHIRELLLLNMNLSGNLAPQLGQFSQLRILDFMWNDLDGSIPKEIGNISSLRLLLLNGNRLSGSLPAELGYLSNLNRFQVDENQLSGPIPKSYGGLTSVRHIHFNNNSLSGPIPMELSNLSAVLHILLDNNNLSGSLPPELTILPELRILQLDNNNFIGSEIPTAYANFPNLVKLSLRNCGLNGAIPDFSSIQTLLYMDLSQNSLVGPIPSKLSDNMTTINLADNRLNGTIPESLSDLPFLQRMSLQNNFFTGSIPANIWKNKPSATNSRLTIDLRNNSLSNVQGELNPPTNVILRLGGNPICSQANISNIAQFCRAGGEVNIERLMTSKKTCPIQGCPTNDYYEYVPESPVECFCASPLRIGYRLKSPSFSYFPPYIVGFEKYMTDSLGLEISQIYIDSHYWEKGPRLKMHLKLYPSWNKTRTNTFNLTEVQRIRHIFASWSFPRTDFYGPYELLNFTLLGPYSQMNLHSESNVISKGVWVAIIIGVLSITAAVFSIATVVILRRQARRYGSLSRKRLSTKISMKIDGVKLFSFRELAAATDNFNSSTQVGRGGYGRVYRGSLANSSLVAIKRAEEGSLQGQKEFLTEIKLLSRLHHRNLVSLVGYCDEEGEQMLVYEFMPNGTLRDWLSAKSKGTLDFITRLKMALDAAKGILYLHTEADPPVYHRDIKASNILLDSKLTAKVADFGLSRLAPVLDDDGNLPNHVSTVVKGTPGYLDPEYFLTHKLTDKSDVYSLGIVFLEVLTGMHPIYHGKNIVREVSIAHKSGIMFSIIDSKMGPYPSECVERFVRLALGCCEDLPENRPSMAQVVRELENILKMVPDPEDYATYSESVSLNSGQSSSTLLPNSATSVPLYNSYASADLSGSDLISGVTPVINPR